MSPVRRAGPARRGVDPGAAGDEGAIGPGILGVDLCLRSARGGGERALTGRAPARGAEEITAVIRMDIAMDEAWLRRAQECPGSGGAKPSALCVAPALPPAAKGSSRSR